jgi:hypothetical protein
MTEVLTLQDYAHAPSPLVAGVAKILQDESKFMDILPFADVGTLSVEVMREGTLPSTIAWRRIGADHGSYRATNPTPIQEHAFSFGNVIEIDKALIKDKAKKLYDPRTYQTEMVTRAMAREFNDAALNGSPLLNVDRPTGLKYRIAKDLSSTQLLFGNTSSATLDLSPNSAALAANIAIFFNKLDALIYSCAGHKADYILCNDTFLQSYWSWARASGLLKVTTDNLGREFTEYKGATFIDMGFKLDDTTRLMTNVELNDATADTGGACSSIIAIRTGKEYFTGWQEYALEVLNKGYKDSADGLTDSTIIDWVVGVALSHPRSVARLAGLEIV